MAEGVTVSNGELCCPSCVEEAYLHHEEIEIYGRAEEDGPTRWITVSPDGEYVLSRRRGKWTGNPSGRRDGIRIQFWCESCNRVYWLLIAQHKGRTEMEWDTRSAVRIRSLAETLMGTLEENDG